MGLKIGSLIYSVDNGLGILAKAFVDHGIVTDVLVVRHGRLPEHEDWHPGAPRIGNLKAEVNVIKEFCREMDVMLFLETPFLWELIDHCRAVETKTILMPMHECLHQNVRQHLPDAFFCPSKLDLEHVTGSRGVDWEPFETFGLVKDPAWCPGLNSNVFFTPVPIEVPWRQRTEAKVFVHNAGNGSFADRNGTQVLLTALRYVKSPANFIIRSQNPIQGNGGLNTTLGGGRIEYRIGTFSQETLWDEGDAFVFPERWNGLSLPLQEARAAGMLVMAGDRSPINTWLPRDPLIEPKWHEPYRIGPPYPEVRAAVYSPQDVAAKIDEWYGRDITQYSLDGKKWAEENSWAVLGPKYRELLEKVANG